jgi:pimeloyl-ACP methyl ester carboxylesterase
MSISEQLGATKEVRLSAGTIRYRERGAGEPIVFVHGVAVNGDLWRNVVPVLAHEHRCIAPDWPLGSHEVPMEADADLSPPGVARTIAEFLEALDLGGVTLVGNDTGGGYCQIAAATHPERIGRLVLTDCDAFDNFPPRGSRTMARLLGHVPALITASAVLLRPLFMKRFAFSIVTKRFFPPEIASSYVPRRLSPGVRRDLAKVARSLRPRYTLEAAARLRRFEKPALIAWSPEDRFFPFEHGRRLAALLPDARLEEIHDSRAFVSEDQPERTAEVIARFIGETPLSPGQRAGTRATA